MPATFPDTKAESWADAITLHAMDERDFGSTGVPRFALLEIPGPDPWAFVLSVLFLSILISSSIILALFQSARRNPRQETAVVLAMPPQPESQTDLLAPQNPATSSSSIPQSAVPVTAEPPTPELAEFRPPPAPVQPLRPTPLTATPLKAEPIDNDLSDSQPIPRELMESPLPILVQPQPTVVKIAPPAAVGLVVPKVNPAIVPPLEASKVAAQNVNPPSDVVMAHSSAPVVVPKHMPESLGALPLSQLIDDEAGLAAGMAALPSAQRLNLPRVSVRVNSEWFQALPQTQERLYFSITAPEVDGEVLAYVPETHSFNLERPERPLWQIRDGDQVPALASLRVAAGRWLGVSPELVGLYTWHPPMLENAMRMFVLERMQELHVQLGPRDVVTVRLASGARGPVMNLEPIRESEPR